MLAMPRKLAGVGLFIPELDRRGSSDATCGHTNQRPSSEFCPLLRRHLGHPTEFREASSAPLVGQQYLTELTQWTRQHCHAHSLSLCYAL